MENNLFTFVFNTLQKRANNPANHNYWLPEKIAGAKKPTGENIIPLNETNWNLGPLSDPMITGLFVDQWKLKLSRDKATKDEYLARHTVIPSPDNPSANLSFPAITINGLHNLFVLGNPQTISIPEGYQTKITLQMDYYNGETASPQLPGLSMNGQYRIVQCLCTADKTIEHPTQGDGWQSISIDGTGTFFATFDQTFVDADLHITVQGTGPNRRLTADLVRIKVRGQNETSLPQVILDPEKGLTIESKMWIAQSIWLKMAKDAIQSPDGQKGIFLQLNASLNSAGNLGSLSQIFTSQLNNILDSTFGAIPSAGLPENPGQSPANPVDRYIFDRARAALNNPAGEWFLPSVVYNSQNPSLEPLNIDIISLPDQNIDFLGEEIVFTQIQLNRIVMTGTSNIITPPPQLACQGADIKALLNLSTLNPPPSVKTPAGMKQVPLPPLTATGRFSMLPEGEPEPLTGAFQLKVQSSNIQIAIQPTGTVLEDLQLKVTQLQFMIQPEMMALSLDIDSAFKKSIEQVFNGPNIKSRIIGELNTALAGKLLDISKAATDAARNTIATRLDG
jgi:hypothetical protein